jgi:dTDP-glucose 4,6-dehydratase
MTTYKIFLTGITGFIGSHLVESLINQGHEIHALVRYKAAEDYNGTPIRYKKVKYHIGNLTDDIGLRDLVLNIDPEIIVHLAALSPVRHSFEFPIEFQQVNYLSTIELIHTSLRLSSFKKFVFASTMETYGLQSKRKPFSEEQQLNPFSPYAVSKVAAEKYIQMAGEAYGLPYFIAKPCNTFGRKRRKSFITEYIITEMLAGREPLIGTPDAIRDLMFIEDHVNAYLMAISQISSGGTYNFGNGSELTMLELAYMIKEQLDFKGDIKTGFPKEYPNRPIIDPYLSLDTFKAKTVLGWEPKVSIQEGIDKTIAYWNV